VIAKVGGAIKDIIADAEQFSRQFRALQLDISGADKATKGLVDTTQMMKNANQLMAAGLPVTAKDFEDLNKVIASTAQSMGKDVTQSVDQAMAALSRGRTSTLKEFGIDIKAGATNAETFAKAMVEIRKKADDAEVKVDDMGERIFIFQNHVGTAIGQIWEMTGSIKVLDSAMDLLNTTLGDLNKEMKDASEQGASLGGFLVSLADDALQAIAPTTALAKEINKLAAAGAKLEREEATGFRVGKQKQRAEQAAADQKRLEEQLKALRKLSKKGKGKGRGKKEKPKFDEVVLPGERQIIIEEQKILIEEKQFLTASFEEEAFLNQQEINERAWQAELEQKDREKQLEIEHNTWLMENSEEFRQEELLREQEAAEEKQRIQRQFFETRIMDASAAFGDLSVLQDVENRKAFKVGKAAALASAGLAGGIAVTQAYARGLEVPFVGWLLGPIYAGFAATKVGVQLAQIAKMQYKGAGGSSAASAGTAPTTGAPAPELGTAQGTGSGERGPQIINVQLGADTLMSALINESKDRDRGGFETILLKAGA
jgi:hypothetical protein